MIISTIAGESLQCFLFYNCNETEPHFSTLSPNASSTTWEQFSFEKCNLCGDKNLDWKASVYFSGEEVLCHELDSKIFAEEGIGSDSSRCEMSRSFYASTCCIEPPSEPCNLCSFNGYYFNMKSTAEVSYGGTAQTCLEVYHSLYARQEQGSEQCTDAQGTLFDQCCEGSGLQTIQSAVAKPASPTTFPSPPKYVPIAAEGTDTAASFNDAGWYDARTIIRSSAPSPKIFTVATCLLPLALGLILS